MTKYVIYRFVKYASEGIWRFDGYAFTNEEFTLEEAEERLKRLHHNGEIQHCKESLCDGEHWWKDEIWAIDHKIGFDGIYTMSDYLKDIVKSGEWDNMTKEQQDIILYLSRR